MSYWSIDFQTGDKHIFDVTLFCNFLVYISGLVDEDRLFRDEKNNKAVALERISDERKQGIHLVKIIFKSCKYNHCPDYMSSTDGSDRPTDKQLHEGDKELTHMCMRIDGNEAYTIFEQRKNGVTIGGVIKYLNQLFKRFLDQENINDTIYLWASIIPPDDFLVSLDSATRISIAEMFVDKKVLGSDYLGLMDIDCNSQDEIIMMLKSKPRESLPKMAIKKAFISLATEGTELKRVRLRGKDINKMDIIIDSFQGKKIYEVTVNLTPNGVVDSYSIFAKFEELLGVTE